MGWHLKGRTTETPEAGAARSPPQWPSGLKNCSEEAQHKWGNHLQIFL